MFVFLNQIDEEGKKKRKSKKKKGEVNVIDEDKTDRDKTKKIDKDKINKTKKIEEEIAEDKIRKIEEEIEKDLIKIFKTMEKDELVTQTAGFVCNAILSYPKYEVIHDYDPPWDWSGELRKIGCLDFRDYETVKEFCEEYTGEKTATYMSGMGWRYNTFDEELLDQIIREYVYGDDFKTELFKLYFQGSENYKKLQSLFKAVGESEDIDKSNISEKVRNLMFDYDLLSCFFIDVEHQLYEYLMSLKISLLCDMVMSCDETIKKSDFANFLRDRQRELELVPANITDSLSDDDVIESYRLCSWCQNPLFSVEKQKIAFVLCETIEEAYDALFRDFNCNTCRRDLSNHALTKLIKGLNKYKEKIYVTITCDRGMATFAKDNWKHTMDFCKEQCSKNFGTVYSIIIRKFEDIIFKTIRKDGKDIPIPLKTVFGVLCIGRKIIPMSPEDLKVACTTDCVTGERLPFEEGVMYGNFNELGLKL